MVARKPECLQLLDLSRWEDRPERVGSGNVVHDRTSLRWIAHDHYRGTRDLRDVHCLRIVLPSVRRALAVCPKLAQLDQRERPVGDEQPICGSACPRAATQSGQGADHGRWVLAGCGQTRRLHPTGRHRPSPGTEDGQTPLQGCASPPRGQQRPLADQVADVSEDRRFLMRSRCGVRSAVSSHSPAHRAGPS